MSAWDNFAAVLNSAEVGIFGEAATYEAVVNGTPSGNPTTVTLVRQTRDQSEQYANYERVWGQFAPAKGDFITLGSTPYVVHQVKPDEDPASNGWRIYLAKRNPNHG